jgi:hypothetical protein
VNKVPSIKSISVNQRVRVNIQMLIQQSKNNQTLQTTNWISATCVTSVKCMDVVDIIFIIKSAIPRQRKTQMRPRLGSTLFLTVYKMITQTVKTKTRGSVDLLLAMKNLLGGETPLNELHLEGYNIEFNKHVITKVIIYP